MRLTLTCGGAVVLLLRIITGATAPVEQTSDAVFIENVQVNTSVRVDGYDFAYQTSDGVKRQESATLKNAGTADEAISVQGIVTWLGPDGVQYSLNYLADENGFQPKGAHLPMSPST